MRIVMIQPVNFGVKGVQGQAPLPIIPDEFPRVPLSPSDPSSANKARFRSEMNLQLAILKIWPQVVPVTPDTARERGPSLNSTDDRLHHHACLNFIYPGKYGAVTAAISHLVITHGWTLYHCGMLCPNEGDQTVACCARFSMRVCSELGCETRDSRNP